MSSDETVDFPDSATTQQIQMDSQETEGKTLNPKHVEAELELLREIRHEMNRRFDTLDRENHKRHLELLSVINEQRRMATILKALIPELEPDASQQGIQGSWAVLDGGR